MGTNRDGKSINTDVCLDFDDVLTEPAGAHGVDPIWQISFILFSQTRLWLYRIFAALLAVPAALMWALVFSLVTVVYVWILAPALRLFELLAAVGRRVFVGVMRCTVEPMLSSRSSVLSNRSVSKKCCF